MNMSNGMFAANSGSSSAGYFGQDTIHAPQDQPVIDVAQVDFRIDPHRSTTVSGTPADNHSETIGELSGDQKMFMRSHTRRFSHLYSDTPHVEERTHDSKENLTDKAASNQRAIDIAKSAGKMALKVVKEFSDAFPPLQSVAKALDFVVENVEVCD
jgi:hypothetical protein